MNEIIFMLILLIFCIAISIFTIKTKKISKWHLSRIILSIFFTILILKLISVIQTIYNYIIARWMLDVIEFELPSIDFQLMHLLILFWNYFVAFFIIICIWKWFALPTKVYHGLLSGLKNYMFPRHSYGEDKDE